VRTLPLEKVATFIRGVTFKPSDICEEDQPGSLWCMRTKNVQGELDLADVWSIPRSLVRRSEQILKTGDVLISSANSWNLVGKCCWIPELKHEATFGGFVTTLRANPSEIYPRYLYRWFASPRIQATVRSFGRQTTNISNLDIRRCLALDVPVPSAEEQRRIAAILDQADELRRKRRRAASLLDDLAQSTFLDMFGTSFEDMRRQWPMRTLGSLSTVFSDGPFGSNLKSSHYRDSGIRVIRLQNIGVGRFIDDDTAFISEEYFARLHKHTCLPGDVIIGTLGDPNLRAFVQPPEVAVALNKADCVQMRVDPTKAATAYISALLNQPIIERMAKSLMHGQTRTRISMGQLREMEVPVPPLQLQHEFGIRSELLTNQRSRHNDSLAELDELFSSLQAKAFRGEL